MRERDDPPLLLRLFGGKGGVGKTTLAAAAALGAAEGRDRSAGEGAVVLAVSTDPAHSLGDALSLRLGPEPVRVATRRGSLWAAEMDAAGALERWLAARREALIALTERGTFLDREDVARLLDLGLPGIDELIGLLEAVRTARRLGCSVLVLDTAPTAHTLRLLGMPATLRGSAALLLRFADKPRLIAESFGGTWRPDAVDAAAQEIAEEAREIEELLRDPARTDFTWVLLPETLSVAETRDGLHALAELAIPVGELAVNRVTPPRTAARCPICAARRVLELEAVETVQREYPDLPLRLLPAVDREPRGLTALRRFARALASSSRGRDLLRDSAPTYPRGSIRALPAHSTTALPVGPLADVLGRLFASPLEPEAEGAGTDAPISPWLSTLAPPGLDLLFVGGKGGVGKTTCAAAIALAAARARPKSRVLLLSADPAHSVGDVLGIEPEAPHRPALATNDDAHLETTVRSAGRGAEVGRGLLPRELRASAAAPPVAGHRRSGAKPDAGASHPSKSHPARAGPGEEPPANLGGGSDGTVPVFSRHVPDGPANLSFLEVDPDSALARWRARFGDTAEDLLAALTGLPRCATEAATGDLLGLTPPGLDELAVLDALLDLFPDPQGPAPAPATLVVVDTAPTGHALRLLAMPETALAWDHALMSLLLKYREAIPPGPLAAELVELSRGLKRLSALLHDPARARFAVVTRAAELPRRETLRLLDSLADAGIAPAAVLVNALPPSSPGCPRCAGEAAAAARQTLRLRAELSRRGGARAMISTPAAIPPPRGPAALAAWSRTWRPTSA